MDYDTHNRNDMEAMVSRSVIIGAGIGGLATACFLAKAGYEVSVYEKNDMPGGRAGLLEVDGFRFDTGPSWYLMPEVFDHFFSLFGMSAEKELEIVRLDPGYKVFFEQNEPVVVRRDFAANQAAFDAIEPGAGRMLSRYVANSSYAYKVALDHFLYTNFQSPLDFLRPAVLRSLPKMSRLAFGKVDAHVSKQFHDQRLKQILEYPMVFLGASPYDAPALYTLMSSLDFESGVYYPRQGMYSVIEKLMKLSRDLGVKYYFEAPVTKIVTSTGKAVGIELENGELVEADVVVSNADLHFTETKLLAAHERTYPESYWRRRNPGPSALLMYLGVKGALPQLEHHSLLFVDAWRENFEAIYDTKTIPEHASIYLAKATATDPSLAPEGHETLVVLVPLPAGLSLEEVELASLAERTVLQIALMTGIADLPERIVSQTLMAPQEFGEKFHAWQFGALGPAHVLSQSAFFRMTNRSRRVNNLYYVGGSTIPGIGLPMCLISAELLYKHLAGDRRGGSIEQVQSLVGEK